MSQYIVSIQWDYGYNGLKWKDYGPVEASSEREAIRKVKEEIGHSFDNRAKARLAEGVKA